MPSAFTHLLVGAATAQVLPPEVPRRRLALIFGLACAAPDLDVAAFALGIPYSHLLGHRGFSHSLLFAALLGAYLGALGLGSRNRKHLLSVLLVGFVAVASHGLLDAATDAGLGIGFFIPFDNHRYFLPFRPIETSSVNPAHFFSQRGWEILKSEIVWVWLPLALLSVGWQLAKKLRGCLATPRRPPLPL
jgi:inner membrane protein